jgi:hypothetical protein
MQGDDESYGVHEGVGDLDPAQTFDPQARMALSVSVSRLTSSFRSG